MDSLSHAEAAGELEVPVKNAGKPHRPVLPRRRAILVPTGIDLSDPEALR